MSREVIVLLFLVVFFAIKMTVTDMQIRKLRQEVARYKVITIALDSVLRKLIDSVNKPNNQKTEVSSGKDSSGCV